MIVKSVRLYGVPTFMIQGAVMFVPVLDIF